MPELHIIHSSFVLEQVKFGTLLCCMPWFKGNDLNKREREALLGLPLFNFPQPPSIPTTLFYTFILVFIES